MTRRLIFRHVLAWLVVSGIAAFPAVADETPVVTISKVDCDRLVKHQPAPDVAYQPGVDVNGNAVAPADLNGGIQIAVPETIRIPIEVDLFDRFGIPANPDQYEADAKVGEVIYQNGRAYFNGQPLQDEAAADLAELCQKVMRENQ
ncbi:MAG: hypothetical protein ACTSW2_05380 [Alphaproteobacteria bacterium]